MLKSYICGFVSTIPLFLVELEVNDYHVYCTKTVIEAVSASLIARGLEYH